MQRNETKLSLPNTAFKPSINDILRGLNNIINRALSCTRSFENLKLVTCKVCQCLKYVDRLILVIKLYSV